MTGGGSEPACYDAADETQTAPGPGRLDDRGPLAAPGRRPGARGRRPAPRRLRKDGGTVVRQYTVAPQSRFNVAVNAMVTELANEEFGAVVDVLEGSPIIVERSLYHSSGGVQFRGGTATPAMRLP